jgi:hypothetical protein
MILYTEKQLEDCYNHYRRIQIKNNIPFVTLEDFRFLFEQMMQTIFEVDL